MREIFVKGGHRQEDPKNKHRSMPDGHGLPMLAGAGTTPHQTERVLV
jgi:hypothetical protein